MEAPIFIIGRQHSGNTMLASMLGRHPDVLGLRNEGTFFEHESRLDALPSDKRVDRVAEIVARETSGELEISPELLREKLWALCQSKERTPVAELYEAGMAWVAEQYGASRWARKATSYVFYIDDILQVFPQAHLLFLVRNPLDLAASLKRRDEWRRVFRMAWGWNRGMSAALEGAEAAPHRVQIVRYEELVRTAEREMRKICAFVDLSFTEKLLDVPHVNRSETPYKRSSGERGVSASRVCYYPDVLSAEEEAVVRTWTNTDVMSAHYADLPAARDYDKRLWVQKALQSFWASAETLIADHVGALASEPRHVLDRIWRRIG